MPTLLRQNRFEFFFYANEHLPRHIHVKKGGDFAKIDLESVKVLISTFKMAELRKALEITAGHRDEFVEVWNGYFS